VNESTRASARPSVQTRVMRKRAASGDRRTQHGLTDRLTGGTWPMIIKLHKFIRVQLLSNLLLTFRQPLLPSSERLSARRRCGKYSHRSEEVGRRNNKTLLQEKLNMVDDYRRCMGSRTPAGCSCSGNSGNRKVYIAVYSSVSCSCWIRLEPID